MKKQKIIKIILLFLAFMSCISEKSMPQNEFIGRYQLKEDLVIKIKSQDSLMFAHPSFWRTPIILDSLSVDKYVSLLHPEMKFEFIRNLNDKIISLKLSGHKKLNGIANKLDTSDIKPVELLLNGQVEEAALVISKKDSPYDAERIVNLAFSQIRNYPSQSQYGVNFAKHYLSEFPNSINLLHTIGLGSLMNGNRLSAINAFRNSHELDKNNKFTTSVLTIIDSSFKSKNSVVGWKLPFSLDSLFKTPNAEEINSVKDMWSNTDLSSIDSKIDETYKLKLNNIAYKVKIISHKIHGVKHRGAALIPMGAKTKANPALLEIRGVDPFYTPYNLFDLELPKILENSSLNSILLIPFLRGNSFIIEDNTYRSDGSPTNAWHGATDDAIAFLNAAIELVPEIDSSRIGSFGKSRGGTISMLCGIRDERIKTVVAWTGPSDWFNNMGTFGFSLQELVQWGLNERWEPGNGWGSASQFIEQRLKPTIETGQDSLMSIRLKMIASSPLYFTDLLPKALMQYGLNDRSVYYTNPKVLQDKLNALHTNNDYSVKVYDSGHDLPYPDSYKDSRAFLIKNL